MLCVAVTERRGRRATLSADQIRAEMERDSLDELLSSAGDTSQLQAEAAAELVGSQDDSGSESDARREQQRAAASTLTPPRNKKSACPRSQKGKSGVDTRASDKQRSKTDLDSSRRPLRRAAEPAKAKKDKGNRFNICKLD